MLASLGELYSAGVEVDWKGFQAGYQRRSVKDELRHNLIRKLRRDEPIFPGIVGYERTVIPVQYGFNFFPHNSPYMDNGYCEEEMKMVNETRSTSLLIPVKP